MAYDLKMLDTEAEYSELIDEAYCKAPIVTFDGMSVKFFSDKFSHSFYESVNFKRGDKSQFAIRRAWRIMWIKETLEDNTCEIKQGWDKNKKCYDNNVKVYVNTKGFIVVVRITRQGMGTFTTAYLPNEENLTKIKGGPDWIS